MSENHQLKTHPPYFQAIWEGKKRFEIRVNDRDFQEGETIALLEYDPDTKEYTGRRLKVWITYIAQGVFGLPPDLCVMSIAVSPRTVA